jgi:hypothetical protein
VSGCARLIFLLSFWLDTELLLIKIATPQFALFQIAELRCSWLFLKALVSLVSGRERLKKYCSHLGARIFGFWRGFGEGAGLINSADGPTSAHFSLRKFAAALLSKNCANHSIRREFIEEQPAGLRLLAAGKQ